ncbi:MAG: DUF4124 domain-containing protein [Pseudomonadota bacterium]
MRVIYPLIVLLSALPLHAAEVYRSVDEKGNVVFSDTPIKGASKMTIEAAPATSVVVPSIPASSAMPGGASGGARDGGGPPIAGYQDFQIVQPAQGAALVSTMGDVDVSIAVQPELRADLGHGITILLDGQPVLEHSVRLNIALNNVSRGEHTLDAFVTDSHGQTVAQAATVRFSLQRPSLFLPGRQPTQQGQGTAR